MLIWKKYMWFILAIILFNSYMTIEVSASSKEELENSIKENQDLLDSVEGNIGALEESQYLLEDEIIKLDTQLINTMTSIALVEDEMYANQLKVDQLMIEYTALEAIVQEQIDAMQVRMQYMYENGTISYIELILSAKSIREFLNMTEYIASIYEYDENLLKQYQENQATLDILRMELEDDYAILEQNKEEIEVQRMELLQLMEIKRKVSDDYEAQILVAQQEAQAFKELIQQEQAELRLIQEEEERKRLEEETAANSGSTIQPSDIVVTQFDTSIIDNAVGSELGKTIAKYGCQFIGNPYVLGGTSLTEGADCSGFTYRIYKDFGYNIPRTSTDQRIAGVAVNSLAEAQPGDLICYSGHVALYLGSGKIVHASTSTTGIIIGNAEYRSILAIRRVV